MKPVVKIVKDYWKSQSPLFNLDTDILSDCVAALTSEERAVLSLYNRFSDPSEQFLLVVHKVFNRHNDVCAGSTTIVNDKGNYVVEITSKSSISELDISLSALRNCNKACINHIEDVNKEILPTLSFDAIAELTSAIIKAENIVAGERKSEGCHVVGSQCDCTSPCEVCTCSAKE